MLTALRRRWKETTQSWLLARQGRDADRVELARGRIYILPTGFGIAYAILVFGMLLGAMNYSNSMAFMLAFLLAALFLLAMHHAHRNLLGLTLERGRVESPFAGQQAEFTVRVLNPSPTARWAVASDTEGQPAYIVDVPALDSAILPLPVSAPTRGVLTVPSARIYTRHPFGLFQAWGVLHMDLRVIVYPAPAPDAPRPPLASGEGRGTMEAAGQDDFSGLSDYRGGESPRHIAWKAYARDDQLRVKQFSGALQATQWFDYASLGGIGHEQRLSVLCRWVLDADRDGFRYGVRLPDRTVVPGSGDVHRRQCLEALALSGLRP